MKHLRFLKRRTADERKSFQQLVLSVLGIVSLLFFLFFVGIPLIIKVSSSIAGFKKESSLIQNDPSIILEPFIESLPAATNSATIAVSGSANEGETILLYVNSLKKEEKVVGKDGSFAFNNVSLEKGANQIYAVSKLGDKQSQPSNKTTIFYKNEPPKLEVETPKDKDVFKRENQEIEIKGRTNDEITLTINDRLIIVDPGGSFSAKYRLSDGENKLSILAVDSAGNTQKVELTVTYEP